MPSTSNNTSWPFFPIFILASVLVSIIIYQLDSFDPAHYPNHELTQPLPVPATKNGRMLQGSEFVGQGKLLGPEDILYDNELGVIYTGTSDGWIKRVTVNESVSDSVVTDWVNTGGRPLGLAMDTDNNGVIVADAHKGLLKISKDGSIEVLTEEAEGKKLMFTDGVEVAKDGKIYFTDASYKYGIEDFMWDILEGRPHGRLLSFDPITKITKVLVDQLYFSNGITISPDQDYLVFCETPMRRCRKYYIEGEKKGRLENFIELPAVPDNIHYDGNGHFVIASATEITTFWKLALKYPIVRKIAGMALKLAGPSILVGQKNGGIFIADLDGILISQYTDPQLQQITSGFTIGKYLYCGSFYLPYIIRLDLHKFSAH
ncbi:protein STRICTOSIDINE SYNTHASE-LIKE 6-like [Euphorbia lathyris]|uniref:protein STRICTOSIDINE SYNTHASE-LIKE 6-like n=1 Tax=Euphorbia lathyris TaxID=212925 RepID=UPI0033142DEA